MDLLRCAAPPPPSTDASQLRSPDDVASRHVQARASWSVIAQDALERAHAQDLRGATADATKLYRMGLSVIQEGLNLQVPVPGLGPQHSNVSKWRSELLKWQQLAGDRRAPALRTLARPPRLPGLPRPLLATCLTFQKLGWGLASPAALAARHAMTLQCCLCRLRDLESSCSRLPAASASIPAATAERGRPGAQQSRSLAARRQPASAQPRTQPIGPQPDCEVVTMQHQHDGMSLWPGYIQLSCYRRADTAAPHVQAPAQRKDRGCRRPAARLHRRRRTTRGCRT